MPRAAWHRTVNDMEKTRRWRTLRERYGLNEEGYYLLLMAQGGVCAGCGKTPEETGEEFLHVDHCHDRRAIRGLLCAHCNHGLGYMLDDPDVFRRLAEYLTKPPAGEVGLENEGNVKGRWTPPMEEDKAKAPPEEGALQLVLWANH
jgi:hypothetical protein